MVGSLIEVGLGKQEQYAIKKMLDSKKRTLCGPVAPPDGLYLISVRY
jgi:tRNA pseudouridine38-40 synthase